MPAELEEEVKRRKMELIEKLGEVCSVETRSQKVPFFLLQSGARVNRGPALVAIELGPPRGPPS